MFVKFSGNKLAGFSWKNISVIQCTFHQLNPLNLYNKMFLSLKVYIFLFIKGCYFLSSSLIVSHRANWRKVNHLQITYSV